MTTQQPDPSWFEVDPAFYEHGGECFSEQELFVLDGLKGKRVLVMPASRGEEALSLVNLGASVAVYDAAGELEPARSLATAAKLPIDFYENVAGSPDLPGGPYEAVYSTFGMLDILEYFDDWAQSIAAVLNPGGRLVIHDMHPMSEVPGVHKGIYVVANSYFDNDQGGPSFTMGDLISALGAAGLATIYLEELPDSERYQTQLDRFTSVRWDIRYRLPGAFVLVAVKA